MPRTGADKETTDSIVNAYRLALDDVQNRIHGAEVVLEDWDDTSIQRGSWDAIRAAENATRAAQDAEVVAFLGPFNSGAAAVAIPILCRAEMVMVSPAATYPGLTKQVAGTDLHEPGVYYPDCERNFTRVVPTTDVQGAVAAGWARELGARRVFILDDDTAYGWGIGTRFRETVVELGLPEVAGGPEGIDPRAADYRSLADKIRASGADTVFFGGSVESNAGRLFQDLRAVLGVDMRLMGPDGLYDEGFIARGGEATWRTYVLYGLIPPNRLPVRGGEFVNRYRQRYGSMPNVYAAYGYEAMRVTLEAITRVGVRDRRAVRDAVFATEDYEGALGTWSFQSSGDTTLTAMTGRRIWEGRFEDHEAVVLRAP